MPCVLPTSGEISALLQGGRAERGQKETAESGRAHGCAAMIAREMKKITPSDPRPFVKAAKLVHLATALERTALAKVR